jgi:hypothetical protein
MNKNELMSRVPGVDVLQSLMWLREIKRHCLPITGGTDTIDGQSVGGVRCKGEACFAFAEIGKDNRSCDSRYRGNNLFGASGVQKIVFP